MKQNMFPFKLILGSVLVLVPTLWTIRTGLAKSPSPAASKAVKKQDPSRLFKGYPKSGAFDYFVGGHLNAKLHLKNNDLVWGTWFLDGRSNVGMQSFVNTQGKATSYRNVFDWAIQASHHRQLTGDQMKSLKALLPDLPPSTMHPSLADLLILSFRVEDRWVTRTYDRKNLPKAVTRIYEVMGAPLQ